MTEKIWLVRASGKIYGPHTKDEVLSLLRENKYTAIDEVRSTTERWAYFRDHKLFSEAANQPQSEVDTKSENTKTSTVITQTGTRSGMKKNVLQTQKTLESMSKEIEKQKVFNQQFHTISANDVVNKANRQNLILKISIGFVLFSLVSGLFYFKGKKLLFQKTEDRIAISIKNIEDQIKIGLYKDAINESEKIESTGELPFHLELELSALKVSLTENHKFYREKLLELSRSTEIDKGTQEKFNNAIFISYMLENNLAEAEILMLKMMPDNASMYETKINSAVLDYTKGNYQLAYKKLLSLKVMDSQEPSLVLLRSLVAIALYKQKNIAPLQAELIDLTQFADNNFEWRLEALMLLTYIKGLLQSDDFMQTLESYLDENPFIINDHFNSPYVLRSILDWKNLNLLCKELYEMYGQVGSPRLKAFYASCIINSNLTSSAGSLIDQALIQTPKDTLILAVKYYYLIKTNNIQQAKALLKEVPIGSKKIIHYYLAKDCFEQKYFKCAKEHWLDIINLDSKNALAHVGLAQLALLDKNNSEYENWFLKAKNVAPKYLPVLRMIYENSK